MSETAIWLKSAATPTIQYLPLDALAAPPPDMLAAITFGDSRRWSGDARCMRVGLAPLQGRGIGELWRSTGTVRSGCDGLVRFVASGEHLLGAIEIDERRWGGIAGAAEAAYAALRRFQAGSSHPHVLRLWNYFDAINQGEGDAERYRQFCRGRLAGLGEPGTGAYPAATAIGRRDGDPTLQVYWLAGRAPGVPLENPRQLSAWRYPRQYGPVSPSFSRAMLVSDRLLLISGTASIVGHASCHPGNLRAQLEETLTNITTVVHRATACAPRLPARLGPGSLLKVYLRDAAGVEVVERTLREHAGPEVPYLILEADVCRSELLLEIDCLHAAP